MRGRPSIVILGVVFFLGLALLAVCLVCRESENPPAFVAVPPKETPWISSVVAEEGDGWTELHTAAMHGDKKAVERCLAKGANPNAYAKTAIVIAAANHTRIPDIVWFGGAFQFEDNSGRADVVFVGGTCPSGVTSVKELAVGLLQGETPLHLAVIGGHGEIVKMLIAHGADVNAEADTCVRTWGCDPNQPMGPTALDFAAAQGHAGILRMLLDAGARTGWTGG